MGWIKRNPSAATVKDVVLKNTGLSEPDLLNPPREPFLFHLDEAVDMIKELMVHEIPVALFIRSVQSSVFVQIDCPDSRKIKIAALIRFDQLLIGTDRCGTGREPQNAVRLLNNHGADDGGCLAADCFIIFFSVDSHLYVTPLPLKNSALFCVLNLLYHGLLF